MLHIRLDLEDLHIEATVHTNEEVDVHNLNKWVGVARDDFSSDSVPFVMDNTELAAVVALAIGIGEEERHRRPDMVQNLYYLAERAIRGWPKTIRPIP